ncbi:unnamed protein product [Adineta steineri]|uniref:Uncharacterized protein n=1 Tax=Adineta steineri TaxID=433720 RepID=A0A814VYR5_9BILA|nr:unnamed protein product [Adineta steineri]CAF1452265.1 unnamed protein product [Adineta steineri]
MGCCHAKTSTITTPNIQNSLPKDDEVCPPRFASSLPTHPCRLTEFDDYSLERRFATQYTVTANIRINSPFRVDPYECYRQPDPQTMTLLTSKIIDEVEDKLVTNLSTGQLRMAADGDMSYSFKTFGFKRNVMNESQLSPTVIEAALTHIIDHLDEHPNLVAALKTAKIGYHDRGMMLDDLGVRVFVINGTKSNNAS